MNNSYFGYDCRNNADNYFFASVFDEIEELSYLKRYQNVFHSEISEFAATELLGKLINETFENKVAALDQNDEFFDERKIELDGVFSMKFSKKKCHRKNTIRETDEKIKKAEKDPKTKTIVEFDSRLAFSIKCLDVKQNNTAKPTTRFFSGKMLMIDKISLIGFIHDLIETFCFPNNRTKKICKKYLIQFIHPYHILTDTDSTSMFFIFVCKPESSIPDEKYRDCLFEVVKAKHSEKFQNEDVNKKRKGLKKGPKGMEFKNYAKRINSVRDIETFGQLSQEKQGRFRFSVKNNKIIPEETQKPKLAQINDKGYYFTDGIVSLPFSHPFLKNIVKSKEEKKERIQKYILEEKQNFLLIEKKASLKNHRLSLLTSIFLQKPTYYQID